MSLRFRHLNLRRNPFGAVTLDEHAKLAVVDTDDYLRWLDSSDRVLEFIGDHGRGKTTHLLAIRRHFPDAPYIRATREQGPLSAPASSVVFVDETQWLSRRQRNTLFTPGRSYVVSTHEPLHSHYRRAGLTPRTVELSGLSTDKLARICRRRIERARRDDGPVPTIAVDTLEALIAHHGDDLRAIEEHLYEVFQALETVDVVRRADL